MNPFNEKGMDFFESLSSWKKINVKPYDKNEVDPYTKTRIVLMNGTEFEANTFSHQFARHCFDNDLRREIAESRRIEQQQQKVLSCLKPLDESILEHTISYEQLAVDLTAILAKRESDINVKNALDFALLEDFDHLYRYSNLLDMKEGISGKRLVGGYTEIMPARPTIAEHRHPFDNIRFAISGKSATPLTKLNVSIITAAEQQTMNFYMNVASLYKDKLGRGLYQEIGLIEEQHVSQYESLQPTNCTWLERLLEHEYTECYLYYSCFMDETDERIKKIWELHFMMEVGHLQKAVKLLKHYENKHWQEVIPNGEFPELLKFKPNIEYVRDVIKRTANFTSRLEKYIDVEKLEKDALFFKMQKKVNCPLDEVPSHIVINEHIAEFGKDYRFETELNPLQELQDRTHDNVTVGRGDIKCE